MTKITIDFETRSEIDLKKTGAWPYSEHESTDIMCLAYKINNEVPFVWLNQKFITDELIRRSTAFKDKGFNLDIARKPIRLFEYIDQEGTIIEAHNAVHFELPLWLNVGCRRYGWPEIPSTMWRCSQAKCATHNIPQSLEKAAKALGLPIEKDMEGKIQALPLWN